jgi:hypothetical protein
MLHCIAFNSALPLRPQRNNGPDFPISWNSLVLVAVPNPDLLSTNPFLDIGWAVAKLRSLCLPPCQEGNGFAIHELVSSRSSTAFVASSALARRSLTSFNCSTSIRTLRRRTIESVSVIFLSHHIISFPPRNAFLRSTIPFAPSALARDRSRQRSLAIRVCRRDRSYITAIYSTGIRSSDGLHSLIEVASSLVLGPRKLRQRFYPRDTRLFVPMQSRVLS